MSDGQDIARGLGLVADAIKLQAAVQALDKSVVSVTPEAAASWLAEFERAVVEERRVRRR